MRPFFAFCLFCASGISRGRQRFGVLLLLCLGKCLSQKPNLRMNSVVPQVFPEAQKRLSPSAEKGSKKSSTPGYKTNNSLIFSELFVCLGGAYETQFEYNSKLLDLEPKLTAEDIGRMTEEQKTELILKLLARR